MFFHLSNIDIFTTSDKAQIDKIISAAQLVKFFS